MRTKGFASVAHTGLGNRGYNNPHVAGGTTRDWEIAVTITPMDMGLYARDWEIAVTITPMDMGLQRTHVRCDAIYNHVSF